MPKWVKRLIAASLVIAVLLAAAWRIHYEVTDSPKKAEQRVREFLISKHKNPSSGKKAVERYSFHAYRIGEAAWGVSYASKGVQPFLPKTCFVDRHQRVFDPNAKALSEMLKEELRPRRGDEAFIKRFMLLLNGESYTVLETLTDTKATLALDVGETIQAPAWTGTHSYRFYAHQKIGGVVYRCIFHYGDDGYFQTAEVVRLGVRVEPWTMYQ